MRGPPITRRMLLLGGAALAASGLAVGVYVYERKRPIGPPAGQPEVNAWVAVHADDTVVIRIARSEMGQGVLTGLAQLVAEELECDWAKVRTEYPAPGENIRRKWAWKSMATGASQSIRGSQDYLRQAGAAARTMLTQAAADAWGVPAAQCRAARSVITHGPSGRTLRYGEVAEAAGRLAVPKNLPLKAAKDWTLIGRPLARLDSAGKVDGSLVYGCDFQLRGLLNAAIRQCPVIGGRLAGVDAAAVLARPGVKQVLRVGDDAVAVVADTWWRAKTALDALPVRWDEGPNAALSSRAIDALVQGGLAGTDRVAAGHRSGDAEAALAGAARRVEAVYGFPFQHHATLEPMNATARYTPAADGRPARCEVWAPTQHPEGALNAAAQTAGLDRAQCEVHKLAIGGGFGRRLADDYVRQVVTIAQALPGTPVKLLWSREEDMAHGHYHPITQCRLVAGLDAAGEVQALQMRIAGQSILGSVAPQSLKGGRDPLVFQGLDAPGGSEASFGYTALPHVAIEHAMRNPPVRPGFWRGVNLNQNIFYLESFIDELAHAAGQDPLALRRRLLAGQPRPLAVLEAVAARVGWGRPAPAVDGEPVFRGLARTMGHGSHVAACAEVSVDAAGALKIHRIVAATDCGVAVNPQQIEAQVEGSFAFGLSAALYGECTVERGRIEQSNFHDYPVLRLAAMPKVETIVMPSGGFWGGVGEPTIALAAPAVMNAVFAATGTRIRRLPLGRQALRT
ncbi:MAG TPA: molybdopterin cofactor-binding domain-containing protein [Methylibium sp.]|nr:molybdopterin cofactor-binding domain-containing protein [Methylibium sp.]